MLSLKAKNKQMSPAAIISLSFLAVILIGTVLLTMPFSSSEGSFTDPFTALFTAVSATCVTGLVLVDTGTYWSIFGQIVILVMIQIGGIGLVTFASFFGFLIRKKPELHSIQVASESVNTVGFYDVKYMVKRIIAISFTAELAGACLLMLSYVPKFGLKGVYIAVFLSITAFCNAGFDVMGMVAEPFSSMTSLSSDPITLVILPLIIISGGLGFIVWTDLIEYRKKKRLAFQSKVVLFSTLLLVVLGTVITMMTEWNNPATLGGKDFSYKLGNSFFQSVTLRTAGFNTIDAAGMTPMMKIFSVFLMFVGASSGSTGGGIKITTFAIIVLTVVSVLTGREDPIMLGRKIEKDVVYKAISIMFTFVLLIIISSITIYNLNPGISGVDATFEVTSAISTTGLSTGVTGGCGTVSRIILIVIMFIGRVGPVSLGLALMMNGSRGSNKEVFPVGKIMVG